MEPVGHNGAMRHALLFTLGLSASQSVTFAQSEDNEPTNAPAAVVVTQPPATKLDALDRSPGLTVRGLTKVGELPDDVGATLSIYAVTVDDRQSARLRGIALVVTNKNGSARAYVDEDEISPLIEGVKTLAKMDRGESPLQEARGVYRTKGNITILNVDNNGGRMAIVRTVQVSSLTGELSVAAAKFRATRLNEIARQLEQAQAALQKAKS
jgi:hypothetical protein